MEDEKFKQDLDELFRLFKRLVEKQSMEDIPGVDRSMMKQFQFFFSNYETMKDQISYQLQGQFGEPVKKMVSNLVEQLRAQLGEESEDLLQDEIKVEELTLNPPGRIAAIDEMLKKPGLTEDQINELLDRRANLLE
ncbi:MAG: hypothetical protein KKB74_11330 [Bacteroidetes bacterium]|nr:hypothetical protein [Bacteroidota bacterium]PIQ26204.1 MAG: hypothetical protein COW63_17715 [Bacteroidetes bacterium CG18_big_fil_WC_8_21_14_2_50_41_14]PIY30724.1 MAG: hypothetical protein COZ08_11325 [Bacteroidetes bacterium CG_4_10_14_3_um_filter_42_6]PJB58843.1 MAG: hypothetical protein CO098_06570 [Bacteroidetes bacterium CG_4_9_14_3_um_filter_41_19]